MQKTLYFPIFRQKWQNLHLHLLRVVGPNFHILLGHIGLVVLFCFLFFLLYLTLNPHYFVGFFLLFRVFVCFLFGESLSMSPFLSPLLAFLSLSIIILFLPSFLPCFLSLFLLSCFGAYISYLVSLLLFHEMNNFKRLNQKGFFRKSLLFFVSEGPPHLTLKPSIF